MIQRRVPLPLIVLALLATLLLGVTETLSAEVDTSAQKPENTSVAVPKDSVLHLIPEKTAGIVYCPNLLELDKKLNALAADLLPQAGTSEIFVKMLANIFGAEFESLTQLEEIGLNLNRDFALFFSSLSPLQVSAAVHITDAEVMQQVIAAEATGNAATHYKRVPYWGISEDGGYFAILGNTLVFSQQRAVCENVIDTYNGTMQAITQHPDYRTFLINISENPGQLAASFVLGAMTTHLKDALATDPGLIPGLINDTLQTPTITDLPPLLLANMSEETLNFIAELHNVSATLQVEGTDIQMTSLLEFSTESEFPNMLKAGQSELVSIGEFPNQAIMNCAVQGSPQLLAEASLVWLDAFPKDTPARKAQLSAIRDALRDFYQSQTDRGRISLSIGDKLLGNFLFVYELKDEQKAKTYMDEVFLQKFSNYKEGHAGQSILYNGVEIKSYIFPNFKPYLVVELPDEMTELMPTELRCYYAFDEGQLFFTTGTTNDELIKAALDREAGAGNRFSENLSYQKLIEKLGTDNTLLLAISPIIAAKTVLPSIEKSSDDAVVSMRMFLNMFTNLPDSYSIGFSAEAHENSIETNLLLFLDDFKPLIQMFGMIFNR